MKKVGILGGTFDPIHYGHLLIANEALNRLNLDEIWFMPNKIPPHKNRVSKTTDEERKEMISLSIENHPKFRLEEIELQSEGTSYTYETMIKLQKRDQNIDFYFIIGGDMVEYLPKWYNIEELGKLVTFVGVTRPKYKLSSPYCELFLEIPGFDMSSSYIREQVQNKRDIRYYVVDRVREFIKEKKLYE